jgi:D-alanyl-D-alanine carboxypeptidase/D-alanyl-D-alanine-endopeptidase (penicillin-binding protein 4)
MSRSRLRAAALVAVIVVLAVAAGVAGYVVTRTVRGPAPTALPTSVAIPAAVRDATARPAPVVASGDSAPAGIRAKAVARALQPLLHMPGLGRRIRADVYDPADGTTLFSTGTTRPAAPASTAKLLTAAAVLSVRPATYRIPTTVRAAAAGTVVLVGGGDPTLTGAAAGHPGAYPDAARISDLAAQLTAKHVTVRRIVVDDGLFTGPAVSPAWAPEDVPSSYGSAITAVMSDGGRPTPHAVIRSAQPDLAAGHELADALGQSSLPVSRGSGGTGRVLASVRSAPLSVLIEQMLQESDNVIAECLARQVAIARHDPVSFTGAAAAIRQVLGATLHVSVGRGMVDGSGLAARDRLTVGTVTSVLAAIVARPALRPVLAGLPVAGWSGTLDDRYVSGSARAAAGLVRAKTGTLTGVSALAGLVHDATGQLLVFDFDADRAGNTDAAESALDELASRLSACGCG